MQNFPRFSRFLIGFVVCFVVGFIALSFSWAFIAADVCGLILVSPLVNHFVRSKYYLVPLLPQSMVSPHPQKCDLLRPI